MIFRSKFWVWIPNFGKAKLGYAKRLLSRVKEIVSGIKLLFDR